MLSILYVVICVNVDSLQINSRGIIPEKCCPRQRIYLSDGILPQRAIGFLIDFHITNGNDPLNARDKRESTDSPVYCAR